MMLRYCSDEQILSQNKKIRLVILSSKLSTFILMFSKNVEILYFYEKL